MVLRDKQRPPDVKEPERPPQVKEPPAPRRDEPLGPGIDVDSSRPVPDTPDDGQLPPPGG